VGERLRCAFVERKWLLVTLGSAALVLLGTGCAVDAGVAVSTAGASGTSPVDTSAPTLVTPTAPPRTTIARPTSGTIDAPSTTPPPTTAAPTTTVVPEPVTTLAPAALPEPAPPLLVAVSPVKPGARGDAVVALQQRLLDLGFWVDAVDGRYGHATTQAVMAFQKYTGRPATGAVDFPTAEFLNTTPNRVYATANRGSLVEVDKARQILFVIRDGRTVWAVNTSTGSEKPYVEQGAKDPTEIFEGDAVTPNGWWKVNRHREEGWWEGDLGKIYRPKYFNGGIAVHGMTNIPSRPVSHGCVRVSLPFMDFVWAQDLMPIGMRVWVHGQNP